MDSLKPVLDKLIAKKEIKKHFIEDVLIYATIETLHEYMAEAYEKTLTRSRAKNFNLGKLEAYEDCIRLLNDILNKE